MMMAEPREPFNCVLRFGEETTLKAKIPPTMEGPSELIIGRYPLPFFIDIETAADGSGNLVTKDGSEQKNNGPERVGDQLRGFTFPQASSDAGGGGPMSMFGSFAGASVVYRKRLFDATTVPWTKALETLQENDPRKTDEARPTATTTLEHAHTWARDES